MKLLLYSVFYSIPLFLWKQ